MDISVIIPTYNRANTIERSIRSVMDQTYPVSEIIVVDDGSVDDTQQVVLGIEESRIKYLKQEENRGNAAARNIGVRKAGFDMIAFHDSDDEWRSDKIKKQVEYFEAHENCRFLYTAYEKHFLSYDMIVPDLQSKGKKDGQMLAELLYQNTVGAPTILMEKSLFEEAGGFDESMKNLVDWDFAIRISKKTDIGFLPEVLLDVAASTDAVTSDRSGYYQSRCYLLRKYRDDYLSTGTFNDTVESILAMAYEDGVLEQVKNMLLQYISS